MINALFLITNTWFWILLTTEIILLIWFVEINNSIAAFTSLVLFILAIWFFTNVPIFKWIKNNPFELIKYVLIYFTIGILWSMVKYYFYLRNLKKEILEEYESFKQLDNGTSTFKEYYNRGNIFSSLPNLKTTTQRTTLWATFWPTSMIWFLIDNPIKKLFKFLINDVFVGIYRFMFEKLIGKILDDIEQGK